MYKVCLHLDIKKMFISCKKFSKSVRDVLLSLTWQVKIFLRSHKKFYFCYL